MITITEFKQLSAAELTSKLPVDVSSNGKKIFTAVSTVAAPSNQLTKDQLVQLVLKARNDSGNDSTHVADAQILVDSFTFVATTTPPVTPSSVVTPSATTVVDRPNWLGDWTPDVEATVRNIVNNTKNTSLFVLYNIPFRDNGNFSAGGLHSAVEYDTWVKRVAASIGTAKAIVILEPDALGLSRDSRFTDAMRTERFAILNNAVKVLKTNAPNTLVFVDSSIWSGVDDSVNLLNNVRGADGFSCNVSGYLDQPSVTAYADAVSKRTGLKYVCDTSRNGNGAPHGADIWCNQTDTKIGQTNTMSPTPNCYAYLWIKVPGESDGLKINGKDGDGKPFIAPSAGTLWPEFRDAIYSGNWTNFKAKYPV